MSSQLFALWGALETLSLGPLGACTGMPAGKVANCSTVQYAIPGPVSSHGDVIVVFGFNSTQPPAASASRSLTLRSPYSGSAPRLPRAADPAPALVGVSYSQAAAAWVLPVPVDIQEFPFSWAVSFRLAAGFFYYPRRGAGPVITRSPLPPAAPQWVDFVSFAGLPSPSGMLGGTPLVVHEASGRVVWASLAAPGSPTTACFLLSAAAAATPPAAVTNVTSPVVVNALAAPGDGSALVALVSPSPAGSVPARLARVDPVTLAVTLMGTLAGPWVFAVGASLAVAADASWVAFVASQGMASATLYAAALNGTMLCPPAPLPGAAQPGAVVMM